MAGTEVLVMGRRPKGQAAPEGKGVLVRVSKDAVTILRRLSGFLEKPMSDVVSEIVIEHGRPKLQKLMAQEQETLRREDQSRSKRE